MRLTSPSTELISVINLSGGIEEVKNYLMGHLRNDFFGVEAIKDIYKRIVYLVRKHGKEIPSISYLIDDLSLSDDSRKFLKNYRKFERLKSVIQAKFLIDKLNQYRKVRLIYDCCNKTMEVMQKNRVDIDKVINYYERVIEKARFSTNLEEEIVHIGKNDTANVIVTKILEGKTKSFIPTGFMQFDKINGGYRRGSLISLAATTSGGKSALGIQLLINMYRSGYKVGLVSLEMDHEEIMARILSNISSVDCLRILRNDFSEKEKLRMDKTWNIFNDIGKKNNNYYSIYTPSDDVSIQDVCYRLAKYNYDAILVDYISLLESRRGRYEEPWKALGEIARFMKRFIHGRNMVGILLCQLSDEYKVRYARAIKEHSDNLWSWVYNRSKAEESNHIITVEQQKARNQQVFPFKIDENFSYMRLTDCKDFVNNEFNTNIEDLDELDLHDDLEDY